MFFNFLFSCFFLIDLFYYYLHLFIYFLFFQFVNNKFAFSFILLFSICDLFTEIIKNVLKIYYYIIFYFNSHNKIIKMIFCYRIGLNNLFIFYCLKKQYELNYFFFYDYFLFHIYYKLI